MNLPILCMAASCGHRFQRTAAEVMVDGTCPKCASSDIDVDDDGWSEDQPECSTCGGPLEPLGNLGTRQWYRCRNCGLDQSSTTASSFDSDKTRAVDKGTIERSMEKAFQGLDWDEIRREWAEQDGSKQASIDRAFASLQEPTQTPAASGSCPHCKAQAYNTESKVCASCGYTPEDGTTRATEASRRRASAPPAAPSTGPSPAPSEVNDETARCSFCFKTFPYRSADPTEPVPACPHCGATATSPAGAAGSYTASLMVRTASKVNDITRSILASNPGMNEADARLVANETVRRFPKVVQ